MKLRAVFNKRREVLELQGDALTLGNCREAVCRKFGFRMVKGKMTSTQDAEMPVTIKSPSQDSFHPDNLIRSGENSFDLSLNGRDFLVDDSVSLTGLGIVNGDLIYVVSNTQDQEGAQTSQTADCASSSNLNNVSRQDHLAQHAGSIAETTSVASTSRCCYTTLGTSKNKDALQGKQTQQHLSRKSYVLLCRDGIPDALQEMYQLANVGTIHEAAWVVVYFLMLETGYSILAEDSAMDVTSNEKSDRFLLPVNWNKNGIARLKYTHASCPGLTCSVACTSLGPHVMVHGLADSVPNSEVFQCRLQPTDFVRGNVDLKANGAAAVYYNLHRLSRLVKDQVSYPLLSFMRAALGLPQLCGLMSLPVEVKLLILGKLPVQYILKVSQICRELLSVANDSTLWQHLVFRDFGRTVKEQARNWKEEYISLYKQKQSQDQLTKQVILPMPETYPHSYVMGAQPSRGDTYPPGIIGGHGDLFPNLPFRPGGLNPVPGLPPGAGLPQPRFDPFGPLPGMHHIPGPPRRGPHPGPHGSFPPNFL